MNSFTEKRWFKNIPLSIIGVGYIFFLSLFCEDAKYFYALTLSVVAIFFPGFVVCSLMGSVGKSFGEKVVLYLFVSFSFYYCVSMPAYYFCWSHWMFVLICFCFIVTLFAMACWCGKISLCREARGSLNSDWIFYVLAVVFSILTAVLSRYYYAGADTWQHLAEIRHLADSQYITPYGATYFGNHYVAAYAYNLIYLLWSEIVVISGVQLIYVWQILSGLMAFSALCSSLHFARTLSDNMRVGRIMALLFMLLYFGYFVFYRFGMPLFIFIAQPSFIAEFILFPYALAVLISCGRNYGTNGLISVALAVPVLLVVHVEYVCLYGITCLGIILSNLTCFNKYKRLNLMLFCALLCGLLMSVPAILLKSIAIQGNNEVVSIDPNKIITYAANYWIFNGNQFVMINPALLGVLEYTVYLVAILLFMKKHGEVGSKVLLLSIFAPVVIAFNPWFCAWVARLVTPYLVGRMVFSSIDSIGLYCVLYFIAVGVIYSYKTWSKSEKRMPLNDYCLLAFFVSCAVLLPQLPEKIAVFNSKKMNTEVLSRDPLFLFINTLPSGGVIMANKKFSYILPAFVNDYVLQTRTNLGISDGYERSRLFVNAFDGSRSIDRSMVEELNEYHVDYVLLNKISPFEQEANKKFAKCQSMFTKLYEDEGRIFYAYKSIIGDAYCSENGAPNDYTPKVCGDMTVSVSPLFDMSKDGGVCGLFDDGVEEALVWNHGEDVDFHVQLKSLKYVDSLNVVRTHADDFSYLKGIEVYASGDDSVAALVDSQKEPFSQLQGRYETSVKIGRYVRSLDVKFIGNYDNPISISKISIQ